MSLVIDADGHVEEDLGELIRAMPEELRHLAPRMDETSEDGRFRMLVDGRPWEPKFRFPHGERTHTNAGGEYRAGGRDPEVRLKVLDAEGIDAAVLYPSSGLMFGLYESVDPAVALCRAYNDWLARYCEPDPSRLVGVALLPQQDPVAAADELERAVEEHRFVGGVMRPNRVAGLTVDDPAFDVLWERADHLDVPVVLHEAYLGGGIDTVGHDRARSYAAAHVMSHPLEQMTAMVGLATSGVLQRYPNLRLGFFEAGCGWAPFWQERIEEHFELVPGDFSAGDPAGVLNRRSWLTFELDERMLVPTAEAGWEDNLCWASDFPHFDATFPGAVQAVRDRGLDPELESKLLGGNALEFYGDRLRTLVERRGEAS